MSRVYFDTRTNTEVTVDDDFYLYLKDGGTIKVVSGEYTPCVEMWGFVSTEHDVLVQRDVAPIVIAEDEEDEFSEHLYAVSGSDLDEVPDNLDDWDSLAYDELIEKGHT